MPRRSKVFLPKWMRWFVIPLLLVIWVMITYQAFWTTQGREELGLVGWLGITVICGLIGIVVWLMSSGKLPAYIIEDDSGDHD